MKNVQFAFVENIKLLMKEKGISQAALARAVSVDQTTVSAWLHRRKPAQAFDNMSYYGLFCLLL